MRRRGEALIVFDAESFAEAFVFFIGQDGADDESI